MPKFQLFVEIEADTEADALEAYDDAIQLLADRDEHEEVEDDEIKARFLSRTITKA